jgi:hypothetical protein
MATLFALSDGDISTVGALNSAGAISNSGVVGSVLSANRALAASTTYTPVNNPVNGIALCLSSVGVVLPSDTITIRLSTTNYVYAASGLSPGRYVNSYVATQPHAMVGWVLFKLPTPTPFTAAPGLSVYGPNSVRLLGLNATTPASILVYGSHNARAVLADTLYLTKSLTTLSTVENRTVTGSFSGITNVFIGDGVYSSNDFNFQNTNITTNNSIYIGRGGLYSGVVTMTARNVENVIHVLDGGILSANYATPAATARIKAVSGAIVDLTNVVGWGMMPTLGYAYNFNSDPTFKFEYLHDITTGYAKFNNCTFWKGISCCNLINNVSNLTATNTLFKEKYLYLNTGASATLTGNSNNFFKSKNINSVYFSNISSEEAVTLSGNYNNFNFDNSYIAKEFDILRSNFSNSKISNISFSPNSSLDAMFLSGNTNLPEFENILIPSRKTGLIKADSCDIKLTGLSCLSSYYYSISAKDLTGELRNLYFKDSTYGAYDMTFKSSTAPLFINGLTAIRASNDILSGVNNIGTSVRSLCSPFGSGTSLLLSSIAARVNTPLPKILTYSDDLTIEAWYSPVSSELAGSQSIITIWDQLSTTAAEKGCVLGMYINTTGRIVVNKGSAADGTPAAIITTTLPYDLINQKWYHLAVTKSASKYSCYINGTLAGTATNTTELFQPRNANVYIGARPITRTTFGESLSGYVAGAKVSYGVKYKDEFTPPTTPFITEPGTLFNLTTAFSAEYSNMPLSFIDIEDNKTSYPLTFSKLKFLANNPLSSSLIDVSNSTYETFTINDSDLSTYGSPLITNSNNDYIIGSYIFTKCNFINDPINANTILGYQPYTYRETGFAIQYANGDINNNYKWSRGGKVSLDSSTTFEGRSTEKLESISDDYTLKSNLKLIPVSEGSLVKGIKLTYKTPVTYVSGGSLKIEKNTILGINSDTTLGELTGTNDAWSTVTLSLSNYNDPYWNQKSYVQAYVELTGANNQLHIAKWQTSNI